MSADMYVRRRRLISASIVTAMHAISMIINDTSANYCFYW